MGGKNLVLDEAAVRALVRMEDLIPAMERALADFSSGRVVQPIRTAVPVDAHGGFLFVMPAATPAALGAKLVTLYPNNSAVPTHHAMIQLFRQETGEPLVTMDGGLVTEMRTAAVSAVATRYLARTDARVLALMGSGAQARSHLEALRLVRRFDEVRVWSPHHAAAFAAEHSIVASASPEEAAADADVIVTATTSRTPVLLGDWVQPGAHINAVGAPRPDWRELDDVVLAKASIFVDSRAAALQESGDVIGAGTERIVGEIGEVVAGKARGRESGAEITLFKSLGMAVEDVVAAELVYRAVTGQ